MEHFASQASRLYTLQFITVYEKPCGEAICRIFQQQCYSYDLNCIETVSC